MKKSKLIKAPKKLENLWAHLQELHYDLDFQGKDPPDPIDLADLVFDSFGWNFKNIQQLALFFSTSPKNIIGFDLDDDQIVFFIGTEKEVQTRLEKFRDQLLPVHKEITRKSKIRQIQEMEKQIAKMKKELK